MPHPEHPLIALDHPDAAADLIGERLEAEPLVGRGQGARDAVGRTLGPLHREEVIERLLEPAVQQQVEPGTRYQALARPSRRRQPARQVEPVNGIEEEERAHTLVEVVARAPEGIELGTLGQQVGRRRGPAPGVERLVANRRVG